VVDAREIVACLRLRHVFEAGRRHLAACEIQRAWRKCVADPGMLVCQRRLQREFEGLPVQLDPKRHLCPG
jgi:hypothetical protein